MRTHRLTVAAVLATLGGCATLDADRAGVMGCKLGALTKSDRNEQEAATRRIAPLIKETKELPSGYAFRLPSNPPSLNDVTQWIARERKCCPFVAFALRFDHGNDDVWLELTGEGEAKVLIKSRFLPAIEGHRGSPGLE